MEELRREREGAKASDKDAQRDPDAAQWQHPLTAVRGRLGARTGAPISVKGNDGCRGLLNGSAP